MDKLNLMHTFVAVVESGSYTSAAKRLGKSKALVSKQIAQLEESLAIRLINRTTRHVSFTEISRAYYERAKKIIEDLEELELSLESRKQTLIGSLRITAPQSFGETLFMDAIVGFRQQHPQLVMDIHLSDRYVDIVAEGFDVAVRIGKLEDSSLIATPLATASRGVCASKQYLKQQGKPKTPAQLVDHVCIIDTNLKPRSDVWTFHQNGKAIPVQVKGGIHVNSATASVNAALHGQGIVFGPRFVQEKHLASGALVPLLEGYVANDLGIYAVYPYRKHLSQKTRLFVDYLRAYFNP